MSPPNDEDKSLTVAERNFASEVRRLRLEHGWSQDDLAERMHQHQLPYATQSTVSRIENLARPVRMIESQALSRIFGRTISSMMDPDSREAWLHVADADHTRARRAFAQLRDITRDVAERQVLQEADLQALKEDFGDPAEMANESQELYAHLLRNIQQFVEMDILGQITDDFMSKRASTHPDSLVSDTGVAHLIVRSGKRFRDGKHQEEG